MSYYYMTIHQDFHQLQGTIEQIIMGCNFESSDLVI